MFNPITEEQAGMYRWIRDTCSDRVFTELTGQVRVPGAMSQDLALRAAYQKYFAERAGNIGVASAGMRVGILPPALGEALGKYTLAVEDRAMFEEGLGGRTFTDPQLELKSAFDDLIVEILRLQP